MADTTTTTTTTTETTTKTTRQYSVQDKRIADGNASAEKLITTMLGSPALLAALGSSGYDEASVRAMIPFYKAASDTFAQRQSAMAEYDAALAIRNASNEAARKEHKSYRRIVQVNFKDAVREKLGASGRVPTDHDKFRANARTAYTTALAAPQLPELSKNGFTEARLQKAIAQLDTLVSDESSLKLAESKSEAATAARDAAHEVLRAWISKLRAIANDVLEEKPELLGLLSA